MVDALLIAISPLGTIGHWLNWHAAAGQMSSRIWVHKGWAFGFHDSSLLGWLITLTYLVAAVACARAASTASPLRRFWQCMAPILLALGLNKQLDLQSAFIVAARTIAHEQGWFAYRRAVQYGFAVICLLVAVAAIIWTLRWLRRRSINGSLIPSAALHRTGARRLAFTLAGVALLSFYILLRIATISHGLDFLPTAVRRDSSIAVAELIALLLLIAGATGWGYTDRPGTGRGY